MGFGFLGLRVALTGWPCFFALPCWCGCASAEGGGRGGVVALVGPMCCGKSRGWLGVSLCLVIYRGGGGIGSREDTPVLIPFCSLYSLYLIG